VNRADREGSTAAHLAAANRYDAVLRVLWLAGADLGSKDGRGRTVADAAGNESTAKLLRTLAQPRKRTGASSAIVVLEASSREELLERAGSAAGLARLREEQAMAAGFPALASSDVVGAGKKGRWLLVAGFCPTADARAAARRVAAAAPGARAVRSSAPLGDTCPGR
jgi:hypothetical protein